MNFKKILLLCFLFLPISSLFAKSPNLDITIRTISQSVVESVSKETIIAILDFDADTKKLGSYIKNQLTSDTYEIGDLTIVSRDALDKLEKESDFQYSGYVSDETALSICQKLGASALIFGKIEELGEEYTLTVKMISVETARYYFFRNYQVSSDKKLRNLLKDGENSTREISRNEDEDSPNSFAAHFEGNRYSVNGVAPSLGFSLNYGYSKKINIGIRVGFSYDVFSKDVTIFTIDPLLTGRLYPFSSHSEPLSNLFLEVQAGLALVNVDGEFNPKTKHGSFNAHMICGAGEIGWRFYLKDSDSKRFYLEPYIRAGVPFIFGAGLSYGIAF